MSNSPFEILDLVTGKMKMSGARLILWRDKLRRFPLIGKNHITVMSLYHPNSVSNNGDGGMQEWERILYPMLMPVLKLLCDRTFLRNPVTLLKAALQEKPWNIPNSIKITETECQLTNCCHYFHHRHRRLFCSEAIALIYQLLGFMEMSCRSNPRHFVPGDFGHRVLKWDGKLQCALPSIPMENEWRLIPYLTIKNKGNL